MDSEKSVVGLRDMLAVADPGFLEGGGRTVLVLLLSGTSTAT